MGVFTYSHEEQTHSHSMPDDIEEEVKEERKSVLMEMQQDISASHNAKKVGSIQKVLIDRKESGVWIGRTQFDSPEVDNEVIIDAKKYYLRQGDFIQARIVDASEFDLFAEPIE